MIDSTAALIRLVDAFAAATGQAPSTVSRKLFGSGAALQRIRDGRRSPELRTYDRTIAAISAAWPPGVDWPAGVPRPDAASPPPRKRRAA